MPPKKRAATSKAAAAVAAAPPTPAPKRARRGAKKQEEEEEAEVEVKSEEVVKKEEEEEEAVSKDNIVAKLKAADKNDKRPRIYLPDKSVPNYSAYSVYLDYDCTLNQTNIGHNNNKFYLIQVLQDTSGYFYCWNRWGRVGETGQNNGLEQCSDANDAIKSFEKKFKDKTRNNWSDRANFKPSPGKYTLIEMDGGGGGDDDDDGNDETVETQITTFNASDYQPSKLDAETQDLISMIFDKDMFKGALKKFDINVKKMPLGKLSKLQIAKGFEVLEEIEAALKQKPVSSAKINDLSSKFYTVIPQDFGRQRPPPINDDETLQKKYDMLIVLSDIELAQSMQENAKKEEAKPTNKLKPAHPYDVNYELLKCKLSLVDKKTDEFKYIETYTKQTGGYRGCQVLEAWRVEREDEVKRFKESNSIKYRKLLWHGTNVAVVVAILKTGLRIMPHSGGRVGRGIYFASENGKSAGYVGTTTHKKQNIGIMFLNEVALGKQNEILRDDPSLVRPPNGYDSVLAKGTTEPDPKFDIEIEMDGKKVIIPQGKPINQNVSSSFSQSEYLIYNEAQNRIRYMLKMKF